MKKIFLLAIAVVACATFNTAEAAKKNKKSKKNKTEAKAPVKMVTASDSISYAAGVAMTNGLLPYLINNQGVDTAYMADFVRGFNDIVASGDNPQMKAYAAGMAIANQVKGQMLGGLQGCASSRSASHSLSCSTLLIISFCDILFISFQLLLFLGCPFF